jgi:hypothetical protein
VKSAKLLIDMAREKVHSDAELARQLSARLGSSVERHHVTEWRANRRAFTAEMAAALCDYLELPGEEAREWVALAMIEQAKTPERRTLLERALFACWGLGVVGALSLSPTNDASAKAASTTTESGNTSVTDTLHIVAHWLLQLARAARRAALVAVPLPVHPGRLAGFR